MTFEDFEYEKDEYGHIIITKYTGDSCFIKIPDKIDDENVYEIGNSAFRDMRFIEDVVFPQNLKIIGDYAFCECRSIKELILPEGMLETGSHCFYNCRGLEKITVPVTIEFIADGFVKNCEDLREITVITNGDICNGIVDFINGINNEVCVIFKRQNARIILPEFDYEYIANAPAMRFLTLTHGSGAVFRRALETKGFDYKLYDDFFFRAVLAERPETVVRMALSRLMYPYMLEEKAKEEYIKYIKENVAKVIEFSASQGNNEIIEKIDGLGVFDSDNIGQAVEEAAKCGNSEISAYIMDMRNFKFERKRKTFEL